MRVRVRKLGVLGLAIAALCTFGKPSARAASTSVVISQIYSAQTGTPRLRGDFIELFNLGSTPIDMAGWAIQIAPLDRITWDVIPLSGVLEPGQYFLISGPRSASGLLLPAVDMTSSFPIDPAGGRITITNNTSTLNGLCTPLDNANVVDAVAYGQSNCAGTLPMDGAQGLVRIQGGCVDSDIPGRDFSLVSPYPRNKANTRNLCNTPSSAARRAFSTPTNGGQSVITSGSGDLLNVGSARVESTGTAPSGLAIFGFRQGGNLVTEASVPAAPLVNSALVYVESFGNVSTGIAITNPNTQDVTVQFSFHDANRGFYFPTDPGTITIPAGGQIARFINDLPYGLTGNRIGTIEFTSTQPISLIAIRGHVNLRSEFLITTLPVIPMPSPNAVDPNFLAHFAFDGGWRTDVILVNTSVDTATGEVNFRDPSGSPMSVTIGSFSGPSFPYSIPPRNSLTLRVTGTGAVPKTGSIRITLATGLSTPSALAVFSYERNGIVVSEAGLASTRSTSFLTYAEASGAANTIGSIQSGLALTNATGDPATVTLQLRRFDGTDFGVPANLNIPAAGQVARFLNELFPTLTGSFQGTLHITASAAVGVVGLRTRYNERGDFLVTTVPPVDQNAPTSSLGRVFPHIPDSAGYTTQFVLFDTTGAAKSGNIVSLTTGGQPMALTFQ